MQNLSKKIFADMYYNSLPHHFREEDIKQNFILKRLLEVMVEYGYIPCIDDINKLYHKYDSATWSKNDIKKFAKDYGWEYDERLPIEYQRRLVSHIMELYKMKGTKPCINYVANDMTGYDCTIIERYEGHKEEVGIKLHANEFDELPNFHTRSSIGFFLPFYCVPLLIIYYNFFITHPLNHIKQSIKNTIFYTPMTNPWSRGNKEYYLDGSVLLDGSIYLSSGGGSEHDISLKVKTNIIEHIGTRELISSITLDGYYCLDGSISLDNKLEKQKVISVHEPQYGIIKNIDSEVNTSTHEFDVKEYEMHPLDGTLKLDGVQSLSGVSLKQTISI